MRVNTRYAFKLIAALLLSMAVGPLQALETNDRLEFTPADPNDTNGSYFGFEIAPDTFVYTPIESFDGIVIGVEQPASGSHTGNIDGSENPSIDKPWQFFGNTGMHQTPAGSGGITIIGDDGNGVFQLDFSALGITWNGIPNIPMGGEPTFPEDTGIATLICSTPACTTGDSYVLDFSSHVPLDDPSGFGGVGYVMHLEGSINVSPAMLNLTISVTGGNDQECNSPGGNSVEMTASAMVPDGDEIDFVRWSIDGEIVGEGLVITPFLGLGEHMVAALLQTRNGLSTSKTLTVDIKDTTDPEPIAEFLLKSTGQPVTEVTNPALIEVNIGATDICDPNPAITFSNLRKNDSVNVMDGDTFAALPQGNTNILKFEESLTLSVTAIDASGNALNKTAVLDINIDPVSPLP